MKGVIAGVAAAFAVSAVALAIELYLLSPRGVPVGMHPSVALIFPIALCVFVFAIACILLAPRSTRRIARTVAAFCVAYMAAGVLGIIATSGARRYVFAGVAARSEKLVAAIEAFEADHRRPPSSLQELVPAYLRAVPGTGIGAYPHYEYSVRPGGDGWRLSIPAAAAPMSFDHYAYDAHRREWRSLTE